MKESQGSSEELASVKIWKKSHSKMGHFSRIHGDTWLKRLCCFFGAHYFLPVDELAEEIKCQNCGREEMFFRNHGYEKK